MRMAIEKPDKHLKDSKECFNANVFSVLAVHIESKMIIFYERTAVRFQTFFHVNFA